MTCSWVDTIEMSDYERLHVYINELEEEIEELTDENEKLESRLAAIRYIVE